MNTSATRARTLLALGTLTAASAACWALDLCDHLSSHDDRIDLAAAMTLSVITALSVMSCRSHAQRERLRKAYEQDRDLYTLALKARFIPRDGDGDRAPQRGARQPWVRYYPSEPAA